MNMSMGKKIAGILLAAGASRRMGDDDKLLRSIGGKPLLRHAAEQLCASVVAETIIVVRQDKHFYEKLLDGLAVRVLEVPEASQGMSASLMGGVRSAGPDYDGYLIALADMPDITSRHYDQIVAAFASQSSQGSQGIIRPQGADLTFGHPVLFGAGFYQALLNLDGDKGARDIFKRHRDCVTALPMDDAVTTDLDTPEAWARWEGKQQAK